MSRKISGHLLALFTIVIWGITFIASKHLLVFFTPLQTMLMRFVVAYVVLLVLNHKRYQLVLKQEALFLLLAIFGSTLYFIFENMALTYTLAANVSIIIAIAPMLTAILAHFYTKDERFRPSILIGFLVAFLGVALVVFNGTFILKLNPLGDLLSLLAAVMWAIYSILLKNCVARYDSIYLTKRVIFYSIVTTLPLVLLEHKSFPMGKMLEPKLMISLLFLGVLGSGICYVTWNLATKWLGIVTTNNYIYLNPFVTLVAAYYLLDEPMSLMGIAGAVLIIGGIFVSSLRNKLKTTR